MTLSRYIPICNALVLLLKPLVEIVIHDLESERICYIDGNLSQRRIGDSSLLDLDALESNLDQITYPKINFDGRLVKSISVSVEDNLLICINCDVSVFAQMNQLSQCLLLSTQPDIPESLFKNDWQEKLHHVIHSYLNEKSWHFDSLTQKQKKEVVYYLYQQEAFQEKNAADYIANALDLGRATIFNYLRLWRKTL
ncbi:MAG: PAS domain-containing protein [Legionella sp.]|jgi:predicted transcriptional regulator YheO